MDDRPSRDEYCVIACAEAWRGDGEILASAFGWIPTIGARLAKATFETELITSDGEAYLVANPLPLGAGNDEKVIEGYLPFRAVFDLVWSGRRHAMLGAWINFGLRPRVLGSGQQLPDARRFRVTLARRAEDRHVCPLGDVRFRRVVRGAR